MSATADALDDDDSVTTTTIDDEHRRARGDFLPEEGDRHEPTTGTAAESATGGRVESIGEGPAATTEGPPATRDDEPRIPKSRLDEALMRARVAEANAARLTEMLEARPQQPAAPATPPEEPAYDFAQREKDFLKAMAEFDEDQALTIRKEIDDRKFADIERRAAEAAERKLEQRFLERTVSDLAEQIVRDLPLLAENNYDNDAAKDFTLIREGCLHQGMSLPDAMRTAAARVARLYPNTTPGEVSNTPDDPQQERNRKALERAGRTSQAQPPPPIAGMGNRAEQTRISNVASMTEEEFAAIPDAERKKLRGDFRVS